MKMNKLVILGAAACISLSATASSVADKKLQLPKKPVNSVKYSKTDFGSYVVEKNLRLVPTSVAADEYVVSTKGVSTKAVSTKFTIPHFSVHWLTAKACFARAIMCKMIAC